MNEPKRGWLQRLSEGLSRTSRQMSEQVTGVLTAPAARPGPARRARGDADRGRPRPARRGPDRRGVRRAAVRPLVDEREVKEALAAAVAAELIPRQGDFDPLAGPRPFVVLFVGVNGSGKTTTLGKIAADLTGRGAKVLVAAGDTFRAAAVEQLARLGRARRRGVRSRPARAPTPPASPTTPWSKAKAERLRCAC